MAVTRQDVAARAGVSTAVVSYVVNGGPRPVAAATRAAVERAIAELNYRPNVMARALKGGESGSVGLLVPSQSNPYFAELAEAISAELARREILVLTGVLGGSSEQLLRYVDLLHERRVDGIVAVGGSGAENRLGRLAGSTPLAFVDRSSDVPTSFNVSTRGAEGARRTTEHLRRHGHTIVGCIAGPPGLRVTSERIVGWRQAMGDDQKDEDPLIAHGDFTARGGEQAAISLLSREGRRAATHGARPTALFVGSDIQAMGVIRACDRLGLRVPDDVAIASFDGTIAGAFTHPPLTSLRQPVDAMALAISSFLSEGAPGDMRLDGHLVVRESCGCGATS